MVSRPRYRCRDIRLPDPQLSESLPHFVRTTLAEGAQRNAFTIRAHVEVFDPGKAANDSLRQRNLTLDRLLCQHGRIPGNKDTLPFLGAKPQVANSAFSGQGRFSASSIYGLIYNPPLD